MSNGASKNTKRYETNDVQGAGTFVEVRLALIGESRAFIKESARLRNRALEVEADSEEGDALEAAAAKLGQDWYGKNVIAWNWTDEAGNLLPLPAHDPNVLDLLTQPQLEFLAAAINGSAADQKKQPKRSS